MVRTDRIVLGFVVATVAALFAAAFVVQYSESQKMRQKGNSAEPEPTQVLPARNNGRILRVPPAPRRLKVCEAARTHQTLLREPWHMTTAQHVILDVITESFPCECCEQPEPLTCDTMPDELWVTFDSPCFGEVSFPLVKLSPGWWGGGANPGDPNGTSCQPAGWSVDLLLICQAPSNDTFMVDLNFHDTHPAIGKASLYSIPFADYTSPVDIELDMEVHSIAVPNPECPGWDCMLEGNPLKIHITE